MSNKKKQNTNRNAQAPRRTERNEFLKNHPLAYIAVAIIAFILGNYIFDFIGQLF